MPNIDLLQAIRKAHNEVRQAEQAQAARNVWTFIILACLVAEFILLRLLGA